MADKYWHEVSLTVDGELAEAVAEVLRRYIPDGVVIESTAVMAGPADENGQAVGPLRVCGYIPVDDHLEETRHRIEEGLWYLGRISPLPAPEFKQIQEVNWMEAWKEHYHPIPIGRKLLILPAWIDPTEHERIPIRIELGMAFGTGTHPTTQLCLALAEDFFTSLDRSDGIRVIDIGCGSGILSVAGIKLGAEVALGVDIDPEAVRASGENASLNGVSLQLELGIGSVREVLAGNFSFQKAQLVFANILAPVLVQLLDQGLGELVTPDGWLILSGILAEQSHVVEAALAAHGFSQVDRSQMGDWVALAARR
ncbi:MAG: ribosomal protein L11 methyltransferase [Chloroflexi bacterium RBG_19FT_COMBO_50_10]|nr:MAG: ribosomal protein L11 methyltransferase [Chloroflexi bacterium RBG_19FT_COMBO_50_10]